MEIDASLPPVSLTEVSRIARAAEALGFSALWSTETVHDPFLPGAIIAEQTQRIIFGTAIAVAFAAPGYPGIHRLGPGQASGCRFILGLGTQVKAHIERRFGIPLPVSATGERDDFWRSLIAEFRERGEA